MKNQETKENLKQRQNDAPVMRRFSEAEIKDFVIKLRKKHRDIEKEQHFCSDHNFKLEALAKKNQADLVRQIIHEMENNFDLGFVWDKSLND